MNLALQAISKIVFGVWNSNFSWHLPGYKPDKAETPYALLIFEIASNRKYR